jgi:hypothetical protein
MIGTLATIGVDISITMSYYTLKYSLGVMWWVGCKSYNYFVPSGKSDKEILEEKVKKLENEIDELKKNLMFNNI